MKRNICHVADEDQHMCKHDDNKKKCGDDNWCTTVRNNINMHTNKYICHVHYNDEYICNIYECKGVKVVTSDNVNLYNI